MSIRLVEKEIFGESWYNFAIQHREIIPQDSSYSDVSDNQEFLELWVQRHSMVGRGGYNTPRVVPVRLYTILEADSPLEMPDRCVDDNHIILTNGYIQLSVGQMGAHHGFSPPPCEVMQLLALYGFTVICMCKSSGK